MSLHNCKGCGSLFIKQKSVYCEKCQILQDEYYFQLREFIKTHPRSTIMEIHEQTGIPFGKLLELQKDEYVPFGK